jgi:hypothetical protein
MKFNLWPEEPIYKGEDIELAATLEKTGQDSQRIWFRLPSLSLPTLPGNMDSFVLASLFSAMESSANLVIHGEVSPSLLRNLDEFQKAWTLCLPKKYHEIEFSADLEREQSRVKGNEFIMAFSGGVDSSFTAWQHRPNKIDHHQKKLVAGVMVHGFDIPIEQHEVFARAAEKSRKMLASIDVNLIPVATNVREQRGNWGDTFGAAIASCLMLFQGQYNAGLISSAYAYNDIHFPVGSNLITDPLLSNDSFEIIHYGAAYAKVEKMRQISQWPEARQYLRVCWQGPHLDRNCCRCQKCVTTMLLFRAVGLASLPAFQYDISDREIPHLNYSTLGNIESTSRVIKMLKSLNFPASSTINALKVSVIINRIWIARWRFPWLNKVFRVIEKWWFVDRDLAGKTAGMPGTRSSSKGHQ